MRLVRGDVVPVSGTERSAGLADARFETPAHHIGRLGVVMRMPRADGALFEGYLHHHQVRVVAHDLAAQSFAAGFPRRFALGNECVASGFHRFSLFASDAISVAMLLI